MWYNNRVKNIIKNLTFTVQVFKEGSTFVSYNPELKVASCGYTLEEAKSNLKDAMSGFLKSARKLGTLREILEEAGFIYKRQKWSTPNLLVMDRLSLAL